MDESRQALRKINKYFIVPNTTRKIYTDKDVQTSSSYPYEEEDCGWDHNDTMRVSYQKSRWYFFDTDENVRVDFQNECKTKTQISYVITDTKATTTTLETLTNKTVTFDGTGYKIYGVEAYLSNTPNYARNVSLSCQATMKYHGILPSHGNCTTSKYYLKAAQDLPSACRQYTLYGFGSPKVDLNNCPFAVYLDVSGGGGDQTTTFNNMKNYLGERFFAGTPVFSFEYKEYQNPDLTRDTFGIGYYTFTPTTPNANNQTIDIVQTESKHKYIRGDGSIYEDPASWQTETRYIAK